MSSYSLFHRFHVKLHERNPTQDENMIANIPGVNITRNLAGFNFMIWKVDREKKENRLFLRNKW